MISTFTFITPDTPLYISVNIEYVTHYKITKALKRGERPITSTNAKSYESLMVVRNRVEGSKTFRMSVMIFWPFISFRKFILNSKKVGLYFLESQNKVKVDGRSFPLNQDCKTAPASCQSRIFDIHVFHRVSDNVRLRNMRVHSFISKALP